jgi:hypothetical protein
VLTSAVAACSDATKRAKYGNIALCPRLSRFVPLSIARAVGPLMHLLSQVGEASSGDTFSKEQFVANEFCEQRRRNKSILTIPKMASATSLQGRTNKEMGSRGETRKQRAGHVIIVYKRRVSLCLWNAWLEGASLLALMAVSSCKDCLSCTM